MIGEEWRAMPQRMNTKSGADDVDTVHIPENVSVSRLVGQNGTMITRGAVDDHHREKGTQILTTVIVGVRFVPHMSRNGSAIVHDSS